MGADNLKRFVRTNRPVHSNATRLLPEFRHRATSSGVLLCGFTHGVRRPADEPCLKAVAARVHGESVGLRTPFSFGTPPLQPPPETNPIVFSPEEWQAIFRGLSLPPRQAQIVRMLFEGYSDKQVANELDISVPTVRSHLQRMYSKFRVQDRITLAIYIFAWFRSNVSND